MTTSLSDTPLFAGEPAIAEMGASHCLPGDIIRRDEFIRGVPHG